MIGRLVSRLVAALALVAAPLTAQNLLQNPGFDDNLKGWTLYNYNPAWNSLDANGSTNSGSARASVPGGGSQGGPALAQCLPVSAGASYELSVKVHVGEVGRHVGGIRYYSGTHCTGTLLNAVSANSRAGRAASWYTVFEVLAAPATTQSAEVTLSATTKTGGGAHTVRWDDAYFGPSAPIDCVADATTLCLDRAPGDARFLVHATFDTAQSGGVSGAAHAIPLSSLGVNRGGILWFFDPTNPEVLVKVLDGCPLSQFFWTFIAAGTNVGMELFVADTATGAVAFFHNPDVSPLPPIQNVNALPCADSDL
jgi:hypothetical protein